MGNCLLKWLAALGALPDHVEQQGDSSDVIEFIEKAYNTVLLTKEKLVDMVYSRRDQ